MNTHLRTLSYVAAAIVIILAADWSLMASTCTNPVARIAFDIHQGGFYCALPVFDQMVPMQ